METVVFRSDIARLVLRYLQDQHLERVSKLFCKSSPFLQQEFSAYKQGFRGHSFFPALEEVICEYVKILQIVDKLISTLPEDERIKLRERSLSDKINELLLIDRDSSRSQKTLDEKLQNSSATDTSESCDNSTKKVPTSKRKRAKSTSTEWSTDARPVQKRRRFSQPFYVLNTKHKNRYSRKSERFIVESTDTDLQDEEYEGDNIEATIEETDLSKLEVPKNESTPRNKVPKANVVAKALPEITQAILENAEFQQKLVNNINQALHSAEKTNEDGVSVAVTADCNQGTVTAPASEAQIITSNQLLDEMVRNILEATERDPSFDAIIEEVVGASNKQTATEEPVNSALTPTSTQSRNHSAVPLKPTLSSANILTAIGPPGTTSATQNAPPRTPLIIRHAIATGTSASANGDPQNGVAQLVPQLGPNNNSFSVFMDPSFSISKLVVMNSNESAQKQAPPTEQTAVSIGNTTCEQILSQLTSAPEVPADEQVFFDVSTGQLTFPLYLINDGLSANLPFMNNNEAIVPANVATQCIAAPIVMSTASVENVVDAVPTIVGKASNDAVSAAQQCVAIKTVNNLNLPELAPPLEGATPSTSGIVNTKFSKSLSTPRKRASHVRTLSFSPANSAAAITGSGATPLSTRRQLPASRTRDISAVMEEDELQAIETSVLEKPIIRNVEILPKLPPSSSTSTAITANESSNSCSVPPLFAAEESSNQTVIKTELSLMEICSCPSGGALKSKMASALVGSAPDNTPKRKQSRRTAVRRCKRQLSKSSNEDQLEAVTEAPAAKTISNENVPSSVIENPKTDTQTNLSEKKPQEEPAVAVFPPKKSTGAEISIEEWKKLRSGTNNDLDARLRAINATRIDVQPTVKRDTKRKTRAKRGRAALKRQRKKDQSLLVEEEQEDLDESWENTNGIEEQDEKAKSLEVSPNVDELSDNVTQTKDKLEKSITPHVTIEEPCRAPKDQLLPQPNGSEVVSEVAKRTANIGYLLETPFKDNAASAASFVPPTPGIFLPSLDTPLSKLKPQEDLLESASYLFGSLTKSELGTPMLSAITPGFRFTPLVAKDATPHSVATTEYSSGGSYYRPDESEDLDRNIDKMLRDSAQKRRTECVDLMGMTPSYPSEVVAEVTEYITEAEICVEIPVETLKVAPIVLKRVKSFGTDGNEQTALTSSTSTAIDPHYTLASGLPEICAEKEENCDPLSLSVTSSSSSSSSSSNSSSSSSSDSSSSDCESEAELNKLSSLTTKKLGANTSENALPTDMSLENLSDISSAEDEDWQKLGCDNNPAVYSDDKNPQLVGNDGEVRYPVRSWLTPRKENDQASQATIKMMLKSAEKCNRNANMDQRSAELDLKLERMKEKLKQDDVHKVRPQVRRPSSGPTATTTTRGKRQKSLTELSPSSAKPDKDKASVEVLTALNLSAKKQPPADDVISTNISKTPVKMPPPGDADDNATSNVFESPKVAAKSGSGNRATATASSADLKTLITSKVHTGQRKCLQIEALPAIKSSSRASSKSKQIVRTPLGFKSSSGVTNNDSTCTPSKIPATKQASPKAKIKLTALAGSTGTDKNAKKRASPRLSKAATAKKKELTKIAKKPTKATKRTTTANKKQQQEVLEKIKENKKLLELLDPIGIKKQEPLAGPTSKQNQVPASKDLQQKIPKKTKAANARSKKEKETANSEANTSIESRISKIEELPKEIGQQKIPETASATQSTEDTGDDDDDPLEECVCVSITESNSKCFFTHVYQESKDPPKMQFNAQSVSDHLRKFTMNVAIDADNTHTWRISEEYCLFSCAPTTKPTPLIRNIPKKRKIRITSSSLSSDEVDNPKKQEAKSIEAPSGSRNLQSESIASVSTKQSDSSPLSSNPTDKLEIEDIESILSHIHGAKSS